MSLTSYQTAPPRVVGKGSRETCDGRQRVGLLRLAAVRGGGADRGRHRRRRGRPTGLGVVLRGRGANLTRSKPPRSDVLHPNREARDEDGQRGISGAMDRGPLAPRQVAVSASRPKTMEVILDSLTSRLVPKARSQKASNVIDGLQRTPQRKRQACRAYFPPW